MNDLILTNQNLTMSSREIANLTGKEHKHVLDDVRKMLIELDIQSADFTADYKDPKGRTYQMFNLPKRETLILVSGYSIQLRAKIIDRWQELESKQGLQLPNFSNPAEAAIAWAHQYTLTQQAIATKAEIGSRREATAMSTASMATKQRNAMSITVDKHQEWASVLRVEQVTGQKYSWKPLKEYCINHSLEIKKVNSGMETRFSQVNTYPSEAWFECFSVDITEFK
jgi:phage regulator Rha-like protein